MKRAKKTEACANPLFEKWLDEWRQEALARDSPLVHSFRKALASLRKYPLPLESGRDCMILQYFGHKLCSMLDKKLDQHKKLNNLASVPAKQLTATDDEIKEKRQKVVEKKAKDDSPPATGVEEICLISDDDSDNNDNNDDDDVFSHEDIIRAEDARITNLVRTARSESSESASSNEAYKRFCEENPEPTVSVRKKQPNFLFTETVDSLPGTSSNSNKINGKVAEVIDNEAGTECNAQKKKTDEPKKGRGKHTKAASQKKKTASTEDAPYDSFFLLPNNFDIVLLIDTQETSGGKTKPQDDQTLAELSDTGILFEVRSLKIGDFAWIARCRFTNKELVLPYIVERKRIDDLSASIIDGRYKEQKFRLKQSGVNNVVYMIENYGKNYYGSIPLSSLLQASVNSLIQDGFTVKYTLDHKDSMRYLATMTNTITRIYESKELTSCRKNYLETKDLDVVKSLNVPLMEFNEFNKAAKKTKNFKVREMFMRQLLQLKGVSVDKAIAITNAYPTPNVLVSAFKSGDENLLAKIPFGSSTMKIGPAISKTLYQFYTRYNF